MIDHWNVSNRIGTDVIPFAEPRLTTEYAFGLSRVREKKIEDQEKVLKLPTMSVDGARRDPSQSMSMYMAWIKALPRSHLNGAQGQVGCASACCMSRWFAL